ncbi:hypothetical protein EVAR_43485_1 [Eumeta japonica]|uniref:Uncharacterized protein n=1 Tax=Eumeta variegata TaxID=151549 RepID=A0A4C1YLR3_EUMVA|nr:hypothetical protein EVAR_43485_1 [Eumeta japonica]
MKLDGGRARPGPLSKREILPPGDVTTRAPRQIERGGGDAPLVLQPRPPPRRTGRRRALIPLPRQINMLIGSRVTRLRRVHGAIVF